MPPVSRDYRITDVKLAREIWLGQRAASLLGSIDRLFVWDRGMHQLRRQALKARSVSQQSPTTYIPFPCVAAWSIAGSGARVKCSYCDCRPSSCAVLTGRGRRLSAVGRSGYSATTAFLVFSQFGEKRRMK